MTNCCLMSPREEQADGRGAGRGAERVSGRSRLDLPRAHPPDGRQRHHRQLLRLRPVPGGQRPPGPQRPRVQTQPGALLRRTRAVPPVAAAAPPSGRQTLQGRALQAVAPHPLGETLRARLRTQSRSRAAARVPPQVSQTRLRRRQTLQTCLCRGETS